MSDLKSKLPDLKELGEMTTKLFKDIRNSVSEIIDTYKEKHAQPEAPVQKDAEAQKAEPEKSKITEDTIVPETSGKEEPTKTEGNE